MSEPIMLVEDAETGLELIEYFLKKAGFKKVAAFNSPTKALQKVEQGLKPSFIITDYCMPQMTGTELLENVSKIHCDIPSIIITGDSSSIKNRDKYEIIEKGDTDFFATLVRKVKDSCLDEI